MCKGSSKSFLGAAPAAATAKRRGSSACPRRSPTVRRLQADTSPAERRPDSRCVARFEGCSNLSVSSWSRRLVERVALLTRALMRAGRQEIDIDALHQVASLWGRDGGDIPFGGQVDFAHLELQVFPEDSCDVPGAFHPWIARVVLAECRLRRKKSDSRFGYCNRSMTVQLASLRTSLAGTVAEFRSNMTPMLLLGLQARASGASRTARDARRYLGKDCQQPFISKPRLDAVLDVPAGRLALASTLQTIGPTGIAVRQFRSLQVRI